MTPRAHPHPSAGSSEDVDLRAHLEMAFGVLTPHEAAERFVDEPQNPIDSGT